MIISGYFAYWQKPWYRSKVHLVKDGKPICGCNISKRNEFLWTNSAVECSRCTRISEREALIINRLRSNLKCMRTA